MAYVITSLCTREGDCVDVCPVNCIVPGHPEAEWPLFYIDPDICIDCGACVPACPPEAIFPEMDVPETHARDTALNARFFTAGPGYEAGVQLYEMGRLK